MRRWFLLFPPLLPCVVTFPNAVDKFFDEIRKNKTKMGENGIYRSFPFPRVRIDSRIGCEKSRNEGGRGGPNVPKEVVADVSRDAKGVLASKTNSYPQQPLLAVFFADNLLLAA